MKLHRRGSGRSALFGEVARAMTLAHASNQPGAPPVDELIEMDHQRRLTRRDFLKASLATAGAAALSGTMGPWLLPANAAAQPRLVIVGAGIAGLNAAYHLRNAGLRAAIYEGSSRTSGRMFSRHNVMGPGWSPSSAASSSTATTRTCSR